MNTIEENDLKKVLVQLHELKKYGIRVIPELHTPQPMIDTFNPEGIGEKSFVEIYDKKPDLKISVGKSWSTAFISEVLGIKLSYCKMHQNVQDAKVNNEAIIELMREFNFKNIKKKVDNEYIQLKD